MREWVEVNFSSTKGSDAWQSMWDRAVRIDFAVSRYTNDAELLAFLGSSDDMEIDLRSIAAQKYRARTGDKTGALQMLAVRAPGTAGDVAPPWMVLEATAHSKMEWQRSDRVHKDRGRGQGRGRGDGAPQVKGDGKGRGGGRGRRRGGGGAAAQQP